MVKNHLKTIAAPKSWPVNRKEKKFILRPAAGPHKIQDSVSLNFFLIDMIGSAKTKQEATYILHEKELLVDGIKRKKVDFPVGIMDTIAIKDTKQYFRIMIDKKGKITCLEIDEKEAGLKPYKIIGKNQVKGKIQLNFFDGSNLIIEKGDYKTGDTVLIEVGKKEVKEHFKLEKGNTILLLGGRHKGNIGTIEDILGRKIVYKIESGEVVETLKKYAFVIGKDKPAIQIK